MSDKIDLNTYYKPNPAALAAWKAALAEDELAVEVRAKARSRTTDRSEPPNLAYEVEPDGHPVPKPGTVYRTYWILPDGSKRGVRKMPQPIQARPDDDDPYGVVKPGTGRAYILGKNVWPSFRLAALEMMLRCTKQLRELTETMESIQEAIDRDSRG